MIFRLRVFLPVLLVVSLVAFVAVYKIDSWLKSAIESSLSALTGTKTDIDGLRLSFRDSSLVIERLQLGSKRDAFKNMLEFERIVFDFEFLPLLEKRFVINDFSIRGMDWGTPRESSGFLPPRKRQESTSWFSPYIDQAFESVRVEFNELPVTRLVDFELPRDPRDVLNRIDLESEVALKENIARVQNSRADWSARVNELRDLSDYREFSREMQTLMGARPSDVAQAQEQIQRLRSLLQFFRSEREKAESLYGNLRSELTQLQDSYKQAVEAIESDYRRAAALVSIDNLNLGNLSRLLFGQHWVDRAELVLQYHQLFREKLAVLTESEEEVEVRQRASGRDIVFVTQKRRPSFLLENAEFDVRGLERSGEGRLSQTYELQLQEINSSPRNHGKASSLDFVASFREAAIAGADLRMRWDYTSDLPLDDYRLSVQKIKAENWPVGIPRVFDVQMTEGFANSKSHLKFEGDRMSWVNRVDFESVSWQLPGAETRGFLIRAMYDVLSRINQFYLEFELRKASEEGRSSRLNYIVRSDLDNRLNAAIQALIREQLEEFKQKLRRGIEAEVDRWKKQGADLLAEYQRNILEPLQEKQKMAENGVRQAEQKIKDLEERVKTLATERARREAEKAAEPALERLRESLPGGVRRPF